MTKIRIFTRDKQTFIFDEKKHPVYYPDEKWAVIKTTTETWRFPWSNVVCMQIHDENKK